MMKFCLFFHVLKNVSISSESEVVFWKTDKTMHMGDFVDHIIIIFIIVFLGYTFKIILFIAGKLEFNWCGNKELF